MPVRKSRRPRTSAVADKEESTPAILPQASPETSDLSSAPAEKKSVTLLELALRTWGPVVELDAEQSKRQGNLFRSFLK